MPIRRHRLRSKCLCFADSDNMLFRTGRPHVHPDNARRRDSLTYLTLLRRRYRMFQIRARSSRLAERRADARARIRDAIRTDDRVLFFFLSSFSSSRSLSTISGASRRRADPVTRQFTIPKSVRETVRARARARRIRGEPGAELFFRTPT